MLRQQSEKSTGEFNKSLADFVAPRETGLADHIGAFVVTTGIGLDEIVRAYKADNDDYNAIMAEALADRLAEAFAERLHQIVRAEWGYGERRKPDPRRPGARTLSRHSSRARLSRLPRPYRKVAPLRPLNATASTGVTLTESLAMHPGSSVSGLYLAHPQADYFAVGPVERDQVTEYAARKGMPLSEVERWLSPNLNYEP